MPRVSGIECDLCGQFTRDGFTVKGASTSYCEDAREITSSAFEIYDSTKTLTLKGWAPSTNYGHKLTFSFEVKTAEEIAMSRSGYY